ncbi:hypothetical protein DL96DRAFT_1682509 [Flagelloscypha sp. PMI_526]|nr:hypothetical protein DL96DRAFT_1682509 [Flagelloscypha sp. PMI_526]
MVHPSLPLDVLQDIIEWAAESDRSLQTTSMLSLVSKEVQLCSDKYLFRNIIIPDTNIPKKMTEFLVDFVQDHRSPRYDLARFHVRRSPLLQTVTHLELIGFYLSKWQTLWSGGLSTLPVLRYLILSGNGRRGSDLTSEDMTELSQNMPPSTRILALAMSGNVDLALMEENHDPRIIIVRDGSKQGEAADHPVVKITNEGFRSWTGERPEEETIWAQIERIYLKQNALLT